MRLIAVKDLKPKDKIARDIYSKDCKALLKKDVILTTGLIQRLIQNNIYYVYIEDEFSRGITINNVINDETKIKAINTIKDIMDTNTNISVKEYSEIASVVEGIMQELKANEVKLYNVIKLMGSDMYTYHHSVNVSILMILLSRSCGYNEMVVKQCGIGGMLHDIGKSVIESDILNKPDKLIKEEFNIMKTHSEIGYNLVKNELSIHAIVKQIIKYHHEKLNGKGYPDGLKGDEIKEYVRMCTICDIFDALTNDRIYKKAMPVEGALDILYASCIEEIDINLCRTFVKNIAIYSNGTEVMLSNDKKYIVVENIHNNTRPKVRDEEGNEIDLMDNKYLNLSITK